VKKRGIMTEKKIQKITMDGDTFIMTIKNSNRHRENWIYLREEIDGYVSYSQIGREDA
jgi:hypothetical protein